MAPEPLAGRIQRVTLDGAVSDVAIPEEVAEPPAVAATIPTETVIRIPFERVMGQLPPGVFRLPLAQVGARLATSRVLLVPRTNGEFAAVDGLGIWIVLSKNLFRTDLVFAAILLVLPQVAGTLLGIGRRRALRPLRRRLRAR